MSPRSGFLSFMVPLILTGAVTHAMDAQESPKTEDYRYYLYRACERLDCYFTVEGRIDYEKRSSPLFFPEVIVEEVGTVDELVEKLRRELKGVKVEVVKRKGKPPVIHLVEESLAKSKDYALDRRVSLTFQGTLSELLTRLEQEAVRIAEERAGAFPVPPPSDSETRTAIKATDAPVREVLTQAVLLEGYKRCLWEAVTHERGGKPVYERDGKPLVKIRFTGPKDWEGWQVETEGV